MKFLIGSILLLSTSFPLLAHADAKDDLGYYKAIADAIVDRRNADKDESIHAIIYEGLSTEGRLFSVQYVNLARKCRQQAVEIRSFVDNSGTTKYSGTFTGLHSQEKCDGYVADPNMNSKE